MKELSIEEKAKAYDEAIEKARIWQEHLYGVNDKDYANELNYIFPELKESEDIRIIKAIKYGLDHVFTNNTTVFEVTKEQCLSWLEAQGEQKPADKVEPKFKVGDIVKHKDNPHLTYILKRFTDDGDYEFHAIGKDGNDGETCFAVVKYQDDWELVEQKPAWSEKDEDRMTNIIGFLEASKDESSPAVHDVFDKWIDFLKSLKNRVQSKTEWSEEDEAMYQGVIETEQYMLDVVNGRKIFDVGNEGINEECAKELNWLNSRFKKLLEQLK